MKNPNRHDIRKLRRAHNRCIAILRVTKQPEEMPTFDRIRELVGSEGKKLKTCIELLNFVAGGPVSELLDSSGAPTKSIHSYCYWG